MSAMAESGPRRVVCWGRKLPGARDRARARDVEAADVVAFWLQASRSGGRAWPRARAGAIARKLSAQTPGPLQALGGEGDRLGSPRIASTRSGARKVSCSARETSPTCTAVAGIEIVGDMRDRLDRPAHQQRIGLRRRRGRALQHEAQFRLRSAAAAAARPPGRAGPQRGQGRCPPRPQIVRRACARCATRARKTLMRSRSGQASRPAAEPGHARARARSRARGLSNSHPHDYPVGRDGFEPPSKT